MTRVSVCCREHGWRPGRVWTIRSSGPDAIVGQRCVVTGVSVIGADAVIASGTTLDGERYPTGS